MNQQKDKSKTASERLVHGYDQLLQRAMHNLDTAASSAEANLLQALDTAKKKAIELGELTREEAEKVHAFVMRDLYLEGQQLAMGERELADWLRLNALLVEKELLGWFSTLSQVAKLELKHLQKAKRRFDEWHTGEVTTIGTLRCNHCGERIHFERTGHIPPCPKCHATVFERVKK